MSASTLQGQAVLELFDPEPFLIGGNKSFTGIVVEHEYLKLDGFFYSGSLASIGMDVESDDPGVELLRMHIFQQRIDAGRGDATANGRGDVLGADLFRSPLD